uniref:gamma-glutamylcyclotransferase family protein n=1 Tax=Thaumasiovibrio occultus TaxID=1891184 RepID=UPI000B35D178|nr:gamma-glutamylcyclotransferase family protein [Thaumasiovibrio occultus]
MMLQVFVYGSLRQGQVNHYWMEGAEFIGTCQLDPDWVLYDLGPYPAIRAGKAAAPLVGEVYRITPEILAKLDELEEYPDLYGREEVATPLGSAWVYFYQTEPQGAVEVVSGDWLTR